MLSPRQSDPMSTDQSKVPISKNAAADIVNQTKEALADDFMSIDGTKVPISTDLENVTGAMQDVTIEAESREERNLKVEYVGDECMQIFCPAGRGHEVRIKANNKLAYSGL